MRMRPRCLLITVPDGILRFAPGNNDDSAARASDAHQLVHKLLLVWHVLTTLHRPGQVKLACSPTLECVYSACTLASCKSMFDIAATVPNSTANAGMPTV
jgi:hypothetical protein